MKYLLYSRSVVQYILLITRQSYLGGYGFDFPQNLHKQERLI